MTRQYTDHLQKDIEQTMNHLYDGPFQKDIKKSPGSHFEIMDNSDFIFFNISEGLKAMDEIRNIVDDPNNRIDLRKLPWYAKSVERYRWPITIALQGKPEFWRAFLPLLIYDHFRCIYSILPALVFRSHHAFAMRSDPVQRLRPLLHYFPLAAGLRLHDGLGGLG